MEATEPRHDVLVVLCRGESRRYGAPKALATVGDDPRPLLARVVSLHRQAGRNRLLVVTTAGLADACAGCLATVAEVEIVAGPDGGDTALTLALAWDHLAATSAAVTHVWAHPVDLPRVGIRTLRQLAAVSAAAPGRLVRPAWDHRPGHPVVLPAKVLARLAPEARDWQGPWRTLLDAAVASGRCAPPLLVTVADPGTILDLDTVPPPDGAAGGTRGG